MHAVSCRSETSESFVELRRGRQVQQIHTQEEPKGKRARLVPEKSQKLAVAWLQGKDWRYLPPHEKRRRIELAKWKEIKAAWHRKLVEEEAQGPRKQKAEPNMRALARRFEATLEKPGSCCFNQLQKDESIAVSADGLRAQCDPSSNGNAAPSGGIKGLPLVAGGKYQYEVELRRGCSLTIGWSPALVLPSAASSGRSAARRMLGYSSDGELIGEGCLIEVPGFGRQGDVIGALLDWQEGSCGPRLSFMLNGRNLGMAFNLRAEGIEMPPLQPHICQGQGRPLSVLLRGASPQVPLRFPMPGYRPLGLTPVTNSKCFKLELLFSLHVLWIRSTWLKALRLLQKRWMSRDKAAKYARSLQRNISLYFPFLAYYQISYYKSALFDIPEIGKLVQHGFPADLQESLGDSWNSAQLTLKALVSTAFIAAEGLSPRSSWLIENLKADDWLRDWEHLRCIQDGPCWPIFGALALLRDTAWLPARYDECDAATDFSHALRQAVQSNEAGQHDHFAVHEQIEQLCHGWQKNAKGLQVLRAAATLAVADWVTWSDQALTGKFLKFLQEEEDRRRLMKQIEETLKQLSDIPSWLKIDNLRWNKFRTGGWYFRSNSNRQRLMSHASHVGEARRTAVKAGWRKHINWASRSRFGMPWYPCSNLGLLATAYEQMPSVEISSTVMLRGPDTPDPSAARRAQHH
eukprot:Skav219407  [mRNA]  locus=scaffold1139:133189:145306:+ [translate_table: standard]